jgi:hypothetical protein
MGWAVRWVGEGARPVFIVIPDPEPHGEGAERLVGRFDPLPLVGDRARTWVPELTLRAGPPPPEVVTVRELDAELDLMTIFSVRVVVEPEVSSDDERSMKDSL